ncbi:MAG TPA: carbohydrate kinase [Candidatus Barnesiella merdipullorum]|nr:carbohydrate kinase [Candidatus Barnesiella merdipullorum]
MRKIIGIGETILDIIFRNQQPSHAVPGGSTFNTLISLGRLGVPTTFISEVGQDTVGDIILDFMQKNHVATENLDIFCEGKTPISLAFLDEKNEARYMFYNQFPQDRLNFVWPRIDHDDIIIFGSYFALNPALRDKVCEFIEFAKDRKAIIYYDPNFRNAHAHEAVKLMPAVLENLEYADMVKGSTEDFNNLFHVTDPQKIYTDHIQFYCPNFICTQGGAGAELFCNQGNHHFEATPVTPVSTIGAGDSFNAGILFGLFKHDVTRERLYSLTPEEWAPIIGYGMDFASAVCLSMDNYIDPDFASRYTRAK